MYYENVFKSLAKYRVDYIVAGGMAVNLHGIPRFTKDLDILIDPSPKNLKRLSSALKALGYRPKVPVTMEDFLNKKNWEKWWKEKGMRAFTLFRPDIIYEEIDILVHSPVSFAQAKKRRIEIHAGNLLVSLVSIDDLMKMKKKAGRQQDLADIQALKKLKKALGDK